MNTKQYTFVGKGSSYNRTYITRHLYFEIDKPFAISYTKYYSKQRKRIWYLLVILFSFIALYIFLVANSIIHNNILIIGILATISSISLRTFSKKKNKLSPFYILKRGQLNPAIITDVNENRIDLLALIKITSKDTTHPVWGLYSFQIEQLPPTLYIPVVGEKVPIATISDSRIYKEHHANIYPIPIAWGTLSPNIIKTGVENITELEWNALTKYADKYGSTKHLETYNYKHLQLLSDNEIYRHSLDKISSI